MLSKAQIKHISALRAKKYRTEHEQFIVEGKKSVRELLQSELKTEHIYYTQEHAALESLKTTTNKSLLSSIEFGKISLQKNPEGVLALAYIPQKKDFRWEKKAYIALDSIRDPGNFGTIIRLADWFGADILCSTDCVELYNPKVIQASMGSVFHINVHYVNLDEELNRSNLSIYAATLNGTSIYDLRPNLHGILVIGNEARGISAEILATAQEKITIPNKGKAESLNAAMACGILAAYLFK